MSEQVLIVPGIGDSGPQHWQSLWQAGDASVRKVVQRDWDQPVCAEWCAQLEQSVAEAGDAGVVLVAHSLGCLLTVQWAASAASAASAAATGLRIRAALLVAVPDPEGAAFPAQASGFAPLPLQPLPFASTVVASSDDPYGSLPFAQRCAAAWGSRFVEIGAAGHINASSGLGAWPAGQALLRQLIEASAKA